MMRARGDLVEEDLEPVTPGRREEAEAAMLLPPAREDYTLTGYLAEAKPPKVERISQLQRAGHRTLLVAA